MLKLNEPTCNNRIYTEKSFNTLPKMIPVVFNPHLAWFDYSQGYVENLRFENEYLIGDMTVMPSTALETLIEAKTDLAYVVGGVGEGQVKNDNLFHVENFTLEYCLISTHPKSKVT